MGILVWEYFVCQPHLLMHFRVGISFPLVLNRVSVGVNMLLIYICLLPSVDVSDTAMARGVYVVLTTLVLTLVCYHRICLSSRVCCNHTALVVILLCGHRVRL